MYVCRAPRYPFFFGSATLQVFPCSDSSVWEASFLPQAEHSCFSGCFVSISDFP